MIAANIGVTISSDVHTFYGYDTLTVDFVLAFLGWQLDIKDLKQLTINSIKYSSIKEEKKERYLSKLEYEWDKFVLKHLK